MCNVHAETTLVCVIAGIFQLLSLGLIITSLVVTFDVRQDYSQLLAIDRLVLVIAGIVLLVTAGINAYIYWSIHRHISTIRESIQLGTAYNYLNNYED